MIFHGNFSDKKVLVKPEEECLKLGMGFSGDKLDHLHLPVICS